MGQELRLWVSPTGDDANPGTEKEPFATPARARDALRELKRTHPKADITVLLRGGLYRLTETLVFSLEDSGGPDQTITYAGYPGETPILSAAAPVRNWRKPRSLPDLVPRVARDKVWVADVGFVRAIKERQHPSPTVASQMERGWRFFTLYDAKGRLPRARSKGFTLARKKAKEDEYRDFAFPRGLLRDWPDIANAELALIPERIWISNILPLEQVNETTAMARTAAPSTYPLGPPLGIAGRPTAWVENLLAFLDEPGEWVLDPAQARLCLWPRGPQPGEDILVPVLTELIRVEGEIDYDGPQDKPARNLVFRGLTFTHGDRFPWHGRTGWGLQHDWERFDTPTAMMRLRGAENCRIENCHFTTAGCSGLRLDLHCQNNRVVGNHFEHLGGVAILLAGYGPGTKDVNRRNEVADNLIHHVGELYWGSPAIFAWQSGENKIAHNLIHDVPYSGICVTGRIVWDPNGAGECSRTIRWREVGGIEGLRRLRSVGFPWSQRKRFLHSRKNLVHRNEIHHAVQVTGDGNCIYVSGAGEGNVVLENYCHDTNGPGVTSIIRCDDDQHETLVKRNIIFRCYAGRAEGLISKGRNDLIENLVVDLRTGKGCRHRGYLTFPYSPVDGSVIERNVFYSCQKGQRVCWEGRARRGGRLPLLRRTKADDNLYFCTEDPEWGARHIRQQRAFGIELHSLSADPLFRDLAKRDFRFQPGSPALELGIHQPVPLDEVGPRPPYRR